MELQNTFVTLANEHANDHVLARTSGQKSKRVTQVRNAITITSLISVIYSDSFYP